MQTPPPGAPAARAGQRQESGTGESTRLHPPRPDATGLHPETRVDVVHVPQVPAQVKRRIQFRVWAKAWG